MRTRSSRTSAAKSGAWLTAPFCTNRKRSQLWRGVATHLAGFAAANPGTVFEDKDGSLALHFRQAPQSAGAARDAVQQALRCLYRVCPQRRQAPAME